jgi:hypothetical protein
VLFEPIIQSSQRTPKRINAVRIKGGPRAHRRADGREKSEMRIDHVADEPIVRAK